MPLFVFYLTFKLCDVNYTCSVKRRRALQRCNPARDSGTDGASRLYLRILAGLFVTICFVVHALKKPTAAPQYSYAFSCEVVLPAFRMSRPCAAILP